MSTLPPLPPDIGKIAGPLLLGHLLQWGLFGALSVQVYIYFLAFPNDPFLRKVLVYAVYAADLAQTIVFTNTAFKQFAYGFGSFKALNEAGIKGLWFAVPILSAIVAAVVQIFYAYKIKLLAGSNIVAIIVVLFAFVQLGGGIAAGVIAQQTSKFSEYLVTKTLIATGIWNAGSALCDVIIAVAMTYYLSQRKTSWKPTQRIVQRLMRLVIETGILTAAIAVINLGLSLMPGSPTYYQTSSAILGKMYSSSMMVVLNSRIVLSKNEAASIDLASIVSNPETSRRPALAGPHGGITVTHEQWTIPLEAYKIHGQGNKELEANSDNVHMASAI